MIKEGKITFDTLGFIFNKGDKVYCWEQTSKWGAEIASTRFETTFFGRVFVLTLNIIETDGDNFYNIQKAVQINEFDGVTNIDSLNIRLMDEQTYSHLSKRGELYVRVGLGHHFMEYKGSMFRKEWQFVTRYRADGRVMVDGGNFKRFNPGYASNVTKRSQNNTDMSAVPPNKYYMCWPTLKAFSFYAKKWGEVFVDNLSDIQFDDIAFDKLVLKEDNKELLKALVLHMDDTFTDVIHGKGNGCIFLFHGSPGVGKTLTAEAMAELLHTPLYSISIGELGTDASTLEKHLREILEVSRSWNAVILIDEADIFLEKRSEKDIKRNAMVGIFLRLLEYHQGILILTTNRVKSFDDAFYSRITLALKYDSLDQTARNEVWRNLLTAANIPLDNLDTHALSLHVLNGRQIKNSIKLAQALSLSSSKEAPLLSMSHLEKAIGFATQFKRDLTEEDEEKKKE